MRNFVLIPRKSICIYFDTETQAAQFINTHPTCNFLEDKDEKRISHDETRGYSILSDWNSPQPQEVMDRLYNPFSPRS